MRSVMGSFSLANVADRIDPSFTWVNFATLGFNS